MKESIHNPITVRGTGIVRRSESLAWMAAGTIAAILCSQSVSATVIIDEDFSSGASNFTAVAGGTWSVSSGRYVVSSPATGPSNGVLGNISIHDTTVSGDFILSAVMNLTATSSWDDAVVIFGYQDDENYYYVSLNENNDGYTKGIFKVVSGSATQLADITVTVEDDTDYDIEIERSGSSIVARVDNSQVASATDSTFTSGQVGFGTYNDAAQFDDLVVDDGTVAVSGVSVSPSSLSLTVSETSDLTETVSPGNATDQSVTWSSSNTSVATVNASGLVTAVGAGSAVITAETNDGHFTDDCSVSVTGGVSPIIDEDFSGGAGDFTVVAGGTWGVNSGRYVLSSPADSGTNGILGNISVHDTTISGNEYTVSAVVNLTGTATAWNDIALIFGYQDDDNYYYVSLNESNDGNTKGVFKVVSGSPAELADISSSIVSDTDYDVEVVRDGSSIVVKLNSSQVASTSDSSFTGGQVGFGSKNDGGQFDDLLVYGSAAVSAPQFSPGGGSYSSTQNVTISTSTSGATIRYTTDGSTPSQTGGTVYSGAISISSTTTLKAIAYKSGMVDSSVTSETYTITSMVAAPQFSPGGGTYTSSQSVSITTSTSGASIRYTTDGSTPTSTSGTVYSSAVSIGSTTTLKAIAYKSGMTDSPVTTATYTISTGLPAKPNASNTGYSGTLTAYSGSYTITTNGTTIENKIMNGRMHIKANNVTIRNCRWDSGGPYNIQCTYGYTGFLIEDCELQNASSTGIYGGNFTARRVNIHDPAGDGIKPQSNVLVEQCYIHHIGKSDGAHGDAVQLHNGGSNMTFRYNNFDIPYPPPAGGYHHNSAFQFTNPVPTSGVIIDQNWLNGGNYTINNAISASHFTDNMIGRDYQYGVYSGSPGTWSGNVWEDNGQPAP